jgi:hypothetical protein
MAYCYIHVDQGICIYISMVDIDIIYIPGSCQNRYAKNFLTTGVKQFSLCLVHTENLIRIKRNLMRIKFDPRSHGKFDAH